MHSEEAERRLVQGVPAEFFGVDAVLLEDDIGEGAVLHVLEEDPDSLVIVVEVNALDDFIAVEERDQTRLVDNELALGWRHAQHVFESEDFVVGETLYLEDLTKAAPGNRLEDLVVKGRVLFLDLDGFGDIAGDFFKRSQALRLLPLLVQHHLEADEGVLGLRAEIEVLHVDLTSSGQAGPVDCLLLFLNLDGHHDVLGAIILVLDFELCRFYRFDVGECCVIEDRLPRLLVGRCGLNRASVNHIYLNLRANVLFTNVNLSMRGNLTRTASTAGRRLIIGVVWAANITKVSHVSI